jgi:Protein of unknown function (DUF4233)
MTAHPGAAPARPRQVNRVRQLCGMVLVMEAIVIALAIVPAKALEHVDGAVAGGVGGGLAVLAILLSAVVGRPRMGWVLVAGTILQVLVIASGVWVHAMYVLGVIFCGLWLTGIWLARRIERETLERQAAQHQQTPAR